MTSSVRRKIVDSRSSYCPPTALTDLVKTYKKAELGEEIEVLIDPKSKTDPTAQMDIKRWAERSGDMEVQSARGRKFVHLVMKVTKKRGKQPKRRIAAPSGRN